MTRSAEGPRPRARRAAWAVPLVLLAAVVVLAWRERALLLGADLAAAASSPATQVEAALAGQGRARVDDPGGAAVLAPVRFGDVAVEVDGGRARVIAVVDGKGTAEAPGGPATLGYVGREAFTMARCPGPGWCPEGPQLPALEGVLAALRARAAADPRVRVRAWQVRVERERATAGEDYDLALPAGPERRRSLSTLRREGERWVFVDGP